MLALARLQNKGFLSEAEYGRLAQAYQFLRHLEHRLQFDEDRQTHRLPDDPAQLGLLARRMPGASPTANPAESLLRDLQHHFAAVIEMSALVDKSEFGGEGNCVGDIRDVKIGERIFQ